MTLRELPIGSSAVVTAVGGQGALRRHLLDMGVIPGAEVTAVRLAPMGDPMEVRIHGYELTLRLDDAACIQIEPVSELKERRGRTHTEILADHPGLGEGGRFHPKGTGEALSSSTTLTFALVGNQNCGKTTLFNRLTGANQHVGNFPGVTIDRKDGVIRGYPNTLVTDLPGIYSMSPYSAEELVSRAFVLDEHPHAIINILDATNIERNLYLTMQLLEMNVPMVVALNMMDEVAANGGSIDVSAMEQLLGVPVVPISASKNQGVDELIRHAVHIARYQERPLSRDYCSRDDHEGAVHRSIHAVIHLIYDHAARSGLPVRFAACKLIEGDEEILKRLQLDDNERDMLGHIITQLETERGLDAAAAMADVRFDFIEDVCLSTVTRPTESREHLRSRKLDSILTGKYTAIPVFIGVMAAVFYLTFNVIGAWLQGLLAAGVSALTELVNGAMVSAGVNTHIRSLIIDGVFEGVGSVVSFLPVIVTLFFFLSILEDSGYIARVAFVMDKLLRRIGLSGRSIVPMLIGFGCTVPAVMATRTLPSERDRRMTILLTPFMSCTAKLPIYAYFVSAFFPGRGGLIMTGLYLLGIAVGVLAAHFYKATLFRGEAVPFVMELPNYRLPGAKNVARLLWDKAKDFLQRAFSVILIATVVIWLLGHFDVRLNPVRDTQSSILALTAGLLVPLFAPAGLGDWRVITALISGFMSKESVVAALEVLFEGGPETVISPATAASILVFSLLYTPCVAAVSAIKRELGGRWALGVVVWQCAVAWLGAWVVTMLCGG